MERGRIQGLPKFFEYPLLSQERVKLRTSNFVRTFLAPIYWAHRAVFFAIAQLSCKCKLQGKLGKQNVLVAPPIILLGEQLLPLLPRFPRLRS